MEYLKIKDLGPIEEVELSELRQINLFIGESGSGKSTIMKALAMMRWIYKMLCIRTYLNISGIEKSPFQLKLDAILAKNGLRAFVSGETEITYINGSYEIQIKNKRIHLPKKTVAREELTIQKVAYVSDKRVLIPDITAGNVVLRHNMFYLDETLSDFQKAIDAVPSTEMEYLGVRLTVKKSSNTRESVYLSSSSEGSKFDNLPLTKASSGMQSSVALHFIMQYFSCHFNIVDAMNSTVVKYLADADNLSKFKPSTNIGDFPNKRISVHLEEPELSLFPTNQWGLMKYLVGECIGSKNSDIDLTLATHSPYVLTALNIMTLAYRAHMVDGGKSTQLELIPKINPDKVAAWEIRDGRCKNLVDGEMHLIDGTYLDNVSEDYEDLISTLNDVIYG